MTTKEKIIRESIERVTKHINGIDEILNANPLSDIIQLEKDVISEAKKLYNEGKHKESLTHLNEAQKKRDKLLRIAKKQQNSIALIDKKVKLQMELSDLNGELWYIERRNKR